MKKQDVIIIVVLFALLFLWQPIDRNLIRPFFPETEQAEPPAPAAPEPAPASPDETHSVAPAAGPDGGTPRDAAETPDSIESAPPRTEPEPAAPEKTTALENDKLLVELTSRGAGVKRAILFDYQQHNREDSPPVELDFSRHPALTYLGMPGISQQTDFALQELESGREVEFRTRTAEGLEVRRRISLGDDYILDVRDTYINQTRQPLSLTTLAIQVGPVTNFMDRNDMYGQRILGVDTLSPGGESVKYWDKELTKWWSGPSTQPGQRLRHRIQKPVDWIAAKNKYFVQSLIPENGADDCTVYATWDKGRQDIGTVAAAAHLPDLVLTAGQQFQRSFTYYVGPKKLSELEKMGMHQGRILHLGWASPISELLLKILNFLHATVPPFNYGLSIILLTLLIRTIFWPLTHKGTESMRRMGELSPMMKEINEKYKDDPQKRQQELMKFYKENKINPVAGCLPMLVQMPVFIGLFFVLRSAIELRYADFLWIRDLSAPEELFRDVLPFPLNPLPLVMALTMFLQQKMTPTAAAGGDPKQQQMQQTMMKVMPLMLLVFLYNFASGLALYWTTQNLTMIFQQLAYKKRKEWKEKKAEEEEGDSE